MLNVDSLRASYGESEVLHGLDLNVKPGEIVAIMGRNGMGKTTLMKTLMGIVPEKGGDVTVDETAVTGMKSHQRVANGIAYVPQGRMIFSSMTVQENVETGLTVTGQKKVPDDIYELFPVLLEMKDRRGGNLSGGQQQQLAIARALASNPKVLLLDEPTNHLDLSTIQWLENRIVNFKGAVLFITHDRAFLQRLATRIIELDRGKLSSWPGTYHDYLINKEKALEEESKSNALFDKKLDEEEAWIRQGIKARRTRNEGRVRALMAMREEVAKRLKPQAKARIHIEEAEQSGRKVIEAYNISHGYSDKKLIDKLSLKVMRGDRIGLVGNNGVGKSTLLKILLGEIEPDSGTVKIGTNLEIAYFDQLRRHLDPEKTIAQIVGEGSDYIKLNGKDRHVIGYLRGFLFTAKRAMTKIKVLSGGEKNRVILAKLLTKPSNLLVLDEPTNDLDVETLEVLEDRLTEYKGTLIVVSHDREFVDNVVSSILVFEDSGVIQNYAGGFSDWQRHGKHLAEMDNPVSTKNKQSKENNKQKNNNKKLSYKLKLELDALPEKIEHLEQEINELEEQTQAEDFYSKPYQAQQPILEELQNKHGDLHDAIRRWDELESMEKELQTN